MNTKAVTAEEILKNILLEDAAKMLLHHTEKEISHNGITYTMVRKDLALAAMEAYAQEVTTNTGLKEGKWKWVAHSHQIADTGDYDGCYELTTGKISLFTKDDFDEADSTLASIVNELNASEIDFFVDDSDKYILQSVNDENKRLYALLRKHNIDIYEEENQATELLQSQPVYPSKEYMDKNGIEH